MIKTLLEGRVSEPGCQASAGCPADNAEEPGSRVPRLFLLRHAVLYRVVRWRRPDFFGGPTRRLALLPESFFLGGSLPAL